MPETSAGLLMYRRTRGVLEVLLVHPGGPYWVRKDLGAWSIPKGRVEDGEGAIDAARREFAEETGFAVGEPLLELGAIKLKSGKAVHAWAFEGDADTAALKSNTMKMEYPARSGKWITIPEVDRAAFFEAEEAKRKINPAQAELIDRLVERLG